MAKKEPTSLRTKIKKHGVAKKHQNKKSSVKKYASQGR